MELELVPEDQPEAANQDNVIPDGYDPKNSADKLEPDARYFLVDVAAEQERMQRILDFSDLPQNVLDYIEDYCAT
jgi:hypothetical protein